MITGPSPGGIGAETALSLAKANPAQLILAGRSQQKIQPLIDQIKEGNPDVKTSFVQLDLGSLKSVRKSIGAVEYALGGGKIDVAILNAAVMACPYGLTEDGVSSPHPRLCTRQASSIGTGDASSFPSHLRLSLTNSQIESQFGTNHLGHFLFANLLLQKDLIRSRLVIVGSSASERRAEYAFAPLKDLSYGNGKEYDPILAYTFAKSCNNLFAKRLAKDLKPKGIAIFSLNPGSIATNLQGSMTPEMRNKAIETAMQENPEFVVPERKTLQQGASTQVLAALDPSLKVGSGAYLDDCQVKKVAVHKGHEAYVDQVWDISEELVGEKFKF